MRASQCEGQFWGGDFVTHLARGGSYIVVMV